MPRLKIAGLETRPARNARQHLGPDFVVVVEGENEIGLAGPGQRTMRARLTLDCPADAVERGQH